MVCWLVVGWLSPTVPPGHGTVPLQELEAARTPGMSRKAKGSSSVRWTLGICYVKLSVCNCP